MRIGISQRTMVTEFGEKRDCLDQRWNSYLFELGFQMVPIPGAITDLESFALGLQIDGFILSGGNDLAITGEESADTQRDSLETAICSFAANHRIPTVGICRGFQMINVFEGGNVSPINQHAGSEHNVFDECGLSHAVNSFHNYCVKKSELATSLTGLYFDQDGNVECAQNELFLGIMWHPERRQGDFINCRVKDFLNNG